MEPLKKIKPNKQAYIYYTLLKTAAITLAILAILYIPARIYLGLSIWLFIMLYIIINSFQYAYLSVRHKKEEYHFYKDKLAVKKGSFFSDQETELTIRNITQVWMNLPFIETKLFGTGNILVKAAGSAQTEIYLSSIDTPEKAYKEIEKIMTRKGFVLTRNKLIQKEKPHSIGVFLEAFTGFFQVAIALFVLIATFLAPIIAGIPQYIWLVTLLIILFLLSALVRFSIKFMDLKRRVYYLYEDMIDYYDGFLTQNYSFIPIENLSDSEITQSFIEKIFGLYDVKISCQGTGNEILFTNMENGKPFKKNLDDLIRKTPTLALTKETPEKEKKASTPKQATHKTSRKPIYTSKMDMKRTITPQLAAILILLVLVLALLAILSIFFPSLLIGIPFVFIGAIILALSSTIPLIIKASFTTFRLNSNSVEEDYSFLTSKNTEFTIEKVTSVIFKESFIDKWFGTFSVHFTSIGAGQDVEFSNIKKTKGLQEKIVETAGIKKEKLLSEKQSSFTHKDFFKANLPIMAITIFFLVSIKIILLYLNSPLVGMALLAILIHIGLIAYKNLYYKKSKIWLYEKHAVFQRGLLFREKHYAKYSNIKDLYSLKYPYTEKGSATFNVAGEKIIQGDKGSTTYTSNGFTMHYVENALEFHDYTDGLLQVNPMRAGKDKTKPSQEDFRKILYFAKPRPANQVTIVVLVSIIIFPLILLLPITATFAYIYEKRISYHVNPVRALRISGILYRRKISVLFNRFDHLIQKQGFLNKIYGNGTVIIHTTGSSAPELTIRNISQYKEFYKFLEKQYKN